MCRMATLAGLLALMAGPALAELRAETLLIGPEHVWIEVIEGGEVMWMGPNKYVRTQILSGPDIEIVATLTEPDSVALVGAKALVAVVPASHTCDDMTEPLSYYIIALGPSLATDGPLTVCSSGLGVSFVPGAIALEGDPEEVDAYWRWVPGQGFRAWP